MSLVNTQLKIKYSVKQYREDVKVEWNEVGDYVPYWNRLPEYVISRCPICLESHIQPLDTYSLWQWGIRHNMKCVRYSMKGYQHCDHFVGVHTFLNLNGEKPKNNEFGSGDLYSSEPEVPMVTPTLLPDDLESYVVLHSLPICRIEGDQFVPRYALYMLTYYCIDRWVPLGQRKMEWTGGYELPIGLMGDGRPRLGIYWEESNQKPEAWDLEYWLDRGKLYWLDLTQQPNLPLSNNKRDFPYGNIEGVRHGYIYKDGQYEIVSTKPTLEQYHERLKTQHPDLKF